MPAGEVLAVPRAGQDVTDQDPVPQFRDIDDVITYYKALVRTRRDLLQSQWWHRQLLEQGKVLQQQIRAEKEAEILRCKDELVQLQESLEQAQRDICQWVRSCGGNGGALQGVRSGSSCSQGLWQGPEGFVVGGDA